MDFGRPADGPDGTSAPPAPIAQCVSVPTAATGSDVMAAAGLTLRLDKSLTCAINGWPATGCGDPVNPVPAAAASPDAAITLPAPKPAPQPAATGRLLATTAASRPRPGSASASRWWSAPSWWCSRCGAAASSRTDERPVMNAPA